MKVWIVLCEGATVESVFASQVAAEAEARRLQATDDYVTFVVQGWEVVP